MNIPEHLSRRRLHHGSLGSIEQDEYWAVRGTGQKEGRCYLFIYWLN